MLEYTYVIQKPDEDELHDWHERQPKFSSGESVFKLTRKWATANSNAKGLDTGTVRQVRYQKKLMQIVCPEVLKKLTSRQ